LKKVYGAPSIKVAKAEFEKLKQTWSAYPGAVDVWERNFAHIEQLYDYGSEVRKIMYTTNAVESIHSSLRKVTE
jgi:putative transposase